MTILSVQSQVAYGHVGNSAAVFALQRLGYEVWPVPTVVFSNHPGYGRHEGAVQPPAQVRALLAGLEARGLFPGCRAVLSGYLGAAGTGDALLDAVKAAKAANPDALYLCDPVLGDRDSGLYVAPDLPEFFRERALPAADILAPNLFELERLAGISVARLGEALSAARALIARGPRLVLVTSLRVAETPADSIDLLLVGAETAWRLRTPWLALHPQPNGAGDLLSALFLARYLESGAAPAALEAAAASLFAVLEATGRAGTRELRLIAAQDALVAPTRRFNAERLA